MSKNKNSRRGMGSFLTGVPRGLRLQIEPYLESMKNGPTSLDVSKSKNFSTKSDSSQQNSPVDD